MNQTNTVVVLAILVALGMAGSSLTTILPSVYAQTSSGQAGSSSAPISGASPSSSSAPSQQGSQHACPQGTSFSQGQCTVTTTTANQCPSGYTATGTGQGTCGVDACPSPTHFIKAIDSTTALCETSPGVAFPFLCPNELGGTTIQGDQCVAGIACPSGTTLQGQSCVTTTTTRPGQGNPR